MLDIGKEAYMEDSDPTIRCIALCHDLGYPLWKIGKINKAISRILPLFLYSKFSKNYFPVQYSYLEKVARILASSYSSFENIDVFLKIFRKYGIESPASEEEIEQLKKLPKEAKDDLQEKITWSLIIQNYTLFIEEIFKIWKIATIVL